MIMKIRKRSNFEKGNSEGAVVAFETLADAVITFFV